MRKNLRAGGLVVALLSCALAVSAAQPNVSDLIQAVRSGDEAACTQAIKQLIVQADKAEGAVPALVEALKSDSAAIRALALECLGHMGEAARPAVPAMVALIGDPDAKVRRQVIEAVGEIRPGPEVVLPLLVQVLKDADPAARLRALNALADQGEEAVPKLVEALKDEEAAYWACLVISEIGPPAKAAVPALVGLLGSEDLSLRREAMLALAEIGEAAAPAVPELVKSLDCPVNNTPATYALGAIGQLPAEAEAKIAQNADGADPILAAVSAWALARTKPDDAARMQKAVRLLVARLMGDDPKVRAAAAQALLDLQPAPEIARPIWEAAIENAEEEKVVAALDAMAGLGAAVVPRLIDALENEKTRPYVAYVLGKIGPAAKDAAEPLAGLISDPNPQARREVLFALARIGPGAGVAVPKLIEALPKAEGPDCYGICYALGSIGAAAVAAKPPLHGVIDGTEDESACLFAAWALTQIDSQCDVSCAKAVPVLIRALGDSAADFRLHAAEALGRLGEQAKAALPALNKALGDGDERVRQAAAAAIKAIGT